MELYTLDPLNRRTEVIDRFESLIWTERYAAAGDFELQLPSSLGSRNLLKAGTRLAMNESYRVMTVKTVEDSHDENGAKTLKLKGSSLEDILDDRTAMGSTANLTTTPKWVLTGPPATVARKIFHDICVLGVLNPQDVIPFVTEGTFMTEDTIVEPVDPITLELEPQSVYAATKDICDVWGLGFRLLRHPESGQFYYDVYSGSNRTSSQNVLPPVIFTPELDNLQNMSELTTVALEKNVAYVYSPAGFAEVYAPTADPDVEGFERKVLTVLASDITSETTDVPSALIQRGIEELSKHKIMSAFDGEINQNSQYKYQRDFNLGDVVEMRNTSGATNNMRVTEQIFVSDRQGERSFPTLALNTFITTGSWLSWKSNQVWADFGPTEYWSNQP